MKELRGSPVAFKRMFPQAFLSAGLEVSIDVTSLARIRSLPKRDRDITFSNWEEWGSWVVSSRHLYSECTVLRHSNSTPEYACGAPGQRIVNCPNPRARNVVQSDDTGLDKYAGGIGPYICGRFHRNQAVVKPLPIHGIEDSSRNVVFLDADLTHHRCADASAPASQLVRVYPEWAISFPMGRYSCGSSGCHVAKPST